MEDTLLWGALPEIPQLEQRVRNEIIRSYWAANAYVISLVEKPQKLADKIFLIPWQML